MVDLHPANITSCDAKNCFSLKVFISKSIVLWQYCSLKVFFFENIFLWKYFSLKVFFFESIVKLESVAAAIWSQHQHPASTSADLYTLPIPVPLLIFLLVLVLIFILVLVLVLILVLILILFYKHKLISHNPLPPPASYKKAIMKTFPPWYLSHHRGGNWATWFLGGFGKN